MNTIPFFLLITVVIGALILGTEFHNSINLKNLDDTQISYTQIYMNTFAKLLVYLIVLLPTLYFIQLTPDTDM